MWSGFILFVLIFSGIFGVSAGTCTFPAPFADSSWHDNTKGTVTFTSSTMTGWSFTSYGSTLNDWECLDNSQPGYLVLRATDTVLISDLTVYTFMCLKLTKVTDYSYIYYQMQEQQKNAGEERLKFNTASTMATNEICNSDIIVPPSEFHVLIKTGFEDSAKIECPASLMITADYVITQADETSYCLTSSDVMDVCSNTTEVTFNYTTCSTTVAYSDGGKLSCVASVSHNDYDFVVLYNQDATLSTTARQFSCLATDGTQFSVAPNNCTGSQTPESFPLAADGQIISTSQLVSIQSTYVSCGPTTEPTSEPTSKPDNTGIIVGLVVAAVVIIAIIVIIVIYFVFIRPRGNKIKQREPILKEGINKVKLNNGNWVSGFGGAIPPNETETGGPIPEDLTLQRSKTEPILSLSKPLVLESIETPRGVPELNPLKVSLPEKKCSSKNSSFAPVASVITVNEVQTISKKIEAMQSEPEVVPWTNGVPKVKLPKVTNSRYSKPSNVLPTAEVLPPIKKEKKTKKKKGSKRGNFLRTILKLSDAEQNNKV